MSVDVPGDWRYTADPPGLYAGLRPKLLQSVLTAAFMFVAQRRIYEAVKKVRVRNVAALDDTFRMGLAGVWRGGVALGGVTGAVERGEDGGGLSRRCVA
jgi:hypothetical protein